MADGINSVTGAALDAAPLRAPAKAADPKAADNSATTSAATSATAVTESAKAAQAPISPRLQTDYLTGTIVTEYVGNNGQVTLQLPSAAALAYLRAGLNAEGQPIQKPEDLEKAAQNAAAVQNGTPPASLVTEAIS